MQPGLVTTIVPVFNRAKMLRDAVASVLAQTYRPIEIIIVNDGSTDESGTVADELARDHREVSVIHQSNTGVGPARERGRLAAQGELIQHLDSDDILYSRKFDLQVAGLRAHPECGASYGWTRARLADGTIGARPEGRTGEVIPTMFPAMLQSRWWHTITPLYRATIIKDAGPWLPLRNEEDWEFDARLARAGVRLHYCPEWIGEVHHHAESRLSENGLAPAVLRDRAKAHELILGHAEQAGIGADVPEMKHFSRELFLLSRQCGAAGLAEESTRLFGLARRASGPQGNRLQFRAYSAAARLLGWPLAGRLSALLDRLR